MLRLVLLKVFFSGVSVGALPVVEVIIVDDGLVYLGITVVGVP